MAEKFPQTLENHVKWDPKFHYAIFPFAVLNMLYSIYNCLRNPNLDTGWGALFGTAFALAVFMIRSYSLRVQDRVIRLEELLRMQKLLPANLMARVPELKESQIVALRFASDAELPALVEATLSKKLPQKEIKQQIKSWRADYFRV